MDPDSRYTSSVEEFDEKRKQELENLSRLHIQRRQYTEGHQSHNVFLGEELNNGSSNKGIGSHMGSGGCSKKRPRESACELRVNCRTYYPCCVTWKPCALLTEFWGTAVLVFIGALSTLVAGSSLVSIALAHGLTLFALISAAGVYSGGYFNLGLTLANWICGNVQFWAAILYVIAQAAGAIAGGALLLVFFHSGTGLGTPQLVAPFGVGAVFIAELVGTFVLVVVSLFAVLNSPNVGWTVGAIFVALELVFVPVSGGAFNFWRFLGPAIFSGVFHYWWVYLFAPLIGALIAVLVFKVCVWLKCMRD